MRSGSQCPFEILHLPHSGRGSQQLLISETSWPKYFDLDFLYLSIDMNNPPHFATICEQDGFHAEIILSQTGFKAKHMFWELCGIPLRNRILLYFKC